MASPDFDPFAVLGVLPQATPDEIRSAYRQMAAACHPDTQPPEKKAWASEQMIRLTAARDLLLDPRSRLRVQAARASVPRQEAERDRWRERAAQTAYADARRRQSASPSSRIPVRRVANAILVLGVLVFCLLAMPLLLQLVQNPAGGAATWAGVGQKLLTAAEVVFVGWLLLIVFLALNWWRRRKP